MVDQVKVQKQNTSKKLKDAADDIEEGEEHDGIVFQRTDIKNSDEVANCLSHHVIVRGALSELWCIAGGREGPHAEQGHILSCCTH